MGDDNLKDGKPIPYDPLDWKAMRSKADEFRDYALEFILVALSENASIFVTQSDREVLEIAKRNFENSYDQLVGTFIAPFETSKPAMAHFGYEMIWSLMNAAFHAGSRATASESVESYGVHKAQSKYGGIGGEKSGHARRQAAEEGWIPIAERLIHGAYAEDARRGVEKLALCAWERWPSDQMHQRKSLTTLKTLIREMRDDLRLSPRVAKGGSEAASIRAVKPPS